MTRLIEKVKTGCEYSFLTGKTKCSDFGGLCRDFLLNYVLLVYFSAGIWVDYYAAMDIFAPPFALCKSSFFIYILLT